MSDATEIAVSTVTKKKDELGETTEIEIPVDSEILESSNECASEITVFPVNTEENVVDGIELKELRPHSELEVSLQNACITEITVYPVHVEENTIKFIGNHTEKHQRDTPLLEEQESEIIVEGEISAIEFESPIFSRNTEENVVDGIELKELRPHSESEISLQNACITEITVSPVHDEEDTIKFIENHTEKHQRDTPLLEVQESEIIVEGKNNIIEFESSIEENDPPKQAICIPNTIVGEDKDETESLSIIQTSFTDENEHVTVSTAIVPYNQEKTNSVTLCTFEDNSSSKLPSSAKKPRWGTVLPQCVFCKDFIPKKCPDKSTCWNTIYNSFGEVVEKANAWLSVQTNLRVVGCEAAPMNASGSSAQGDAWPHHTALRGVRIWVRRCAEECPRVVLGYRDFIPRQKKKSMFSGTAQTVEELCDGISGYLTNRLPSVSLVSVQTLDAPVSGMYDADIETESGTVCYSPNGFTRFCRFLRVFFLTEYQTTKTKKRVPTAVVVGIRDFSTRANEDTVTQVIERALAWCDAEPALHLCNLEVLNQVAGQASSSYSWLLESPGMAPNKFYRFVRLVYMVDDLVDDQESLEREWEGMNVITQEPWINRPSSAEFEGRVWNTELKGFSCTSFLPQMVEPHCSGWGGVWETTEELTDRVSAWLLESKRQVVTISTHHVRTVGNSVSLDDTAWVRHAPFAVWLPVIHVITSC